MTHITMIFAVDDKGVPTLHLYPDPTAIPDADNNPLAIVTLAVAEIVTNSDPDTLKALARLCRLRTQTERHAPPGRKRR